MIHDGGLCTFSIRVIPHVMLTIHTKFWSHGNDREEYVKHYQKSHRIHDVTSKES